MNIGEAVAIFQNIEREDKTTEEKGLAIIKVLGMTTHNGITKKQMLDVIAWLWSKVFELQIGE